MKKIGLIVGLIGLFTANTYAQEDTKAKAILDELSKKTKAHKTIYAEFEFSLENEAEKVSETQKGFIYSKGEKYYLSLGGQEIICDGKTIWTYMKDAKEVQISDVPAEGESTEDYIDPNKIFTIYETGFNYKHIKTLEKNGKTYELINLYPKKPAEKPYHTVRLSIDKTEMIINKIMIKGKDGSTYTYSINKFEADKTMDDSKFVFDTTKHPDVEVIDLR